MESIKKHPLLFVVVAVGVISTLVFLYLYIAAKSELTAAQESLKNRQAQYQGLVTNPTPLTAENSELIAGALEELNSQFDSLRDNVLRSDLTRELFAGFPTRREDFGLGQIGYREELTRLAASHERPVAIHPSLSEYGFEYHGGRTPDENLLEPLFQQRRILRFLLRNLIELRPLSIQSVRRGPIENEVPLPEASQGARSQGGQDRVVEPDLSNTPGLFRINPAISARVPGIVKTIPVQISFVGRTETLRQWINSISDSGYPIVVRNVEVRPRPTTARARPSALARRDRPGRSDRESSQMPGYIEVISDNYSIFTVTFEYLVPEQAEPKLEPEPELTETPITR